MEVIEKNVLIFSQIIAETVARKTICYLNQHFLMLSKDMYLKL